MQSLCRLSGAVRQFIFSSAFMCVSLPALVGCWKITKTSSVFTAPPRPIFYCTQLLDIPYSSYAWLLLFHINSGRSVEMPANSPPIRPQGFGARLTGEVVFLGGGDFYPLCYP